MSGVLMIMHEQLGRILLGLAVVLTMVLWSQNGSLDLAPVAQQDLSRQVLVELDKNALPTASQEKFYVTGSGSDYAGGQRYIFVAEKKLIPFQPVELDVPSANVMQPAQILPEPGPTLEGSAKLPRFGDEFPPVSLTPKDPKDPKDAKDPKDPKSDPKDPKK